MFKFKRNPGVQPAPDTTLVDIMYTDEGWADGVPAKAIDWSVGVDSDANIASWRLHEPRLEQCLEFPSEDRIDVIGSNGATGEHYSVVDDARNNGGDTDYYQLKPEWKDCMDIVEDHKLNYSQGNILKVAFTLNVGRHDGTDYERELNKIIFFANREKARINQCT